MLASAHNPSYSGDRGRKVTMWGPAQETNKQTNIQTNKERNQEKFKNIIVVNDKSASFDFLYKHQLFPRNPYFYIRLRKNKILNT